MQDLEVGENDIMVINEDMGIGITMACEVAGSKIVQYI